jgi:hypothetical protein
LLTIPRNTCSRCSEIRAHDPAKRALLRTIQERYLKTGHDLPTVNTTKLVLGMIDEHLALLSDLDRNRLASL